RRSQRARHPGDRSGFRFIALADEVERRVTRERHAFALRLPQRLETHPAGLAPLAREETGRVVEVQRLMAAEHDPFPVWGNRAVSDSFVAARPARRSRPTHTLEHDGRTRARVARESIERHGALVAFGDDEHLAARGDEQRLRIVRTVWVRRVKRLLNREAVSSAIRLGSAIHGNRLARRAVVADVAD